MDPTNMTAMQWIMIGAGLGFVFGLIPLIIGVLKKNTSFGIYGLVASIAGGAALGLLLALPIAAIFTWLIVKKARSTSGLNSEDTGPQNF